MKQTQTSTALGALALLSGTLIIGASAARAADGPSDPQIVGIVLAADQIDIDYGKIALAKSKNKAVREFAQRMVTDHSASSERLACSVGVSSTGVKVRPP
jgi:putative membrane protein